MPLSEKYPFEEDPLFVWKDIEAYASATSVKQSENIDFHVWIRGGRGDFTFEIFRKGLTDTLLLNETLSADEYTTNSDPYVNGCGWPVAHKLSIPSDWQSGAYIAKFSLSKESTEVLFFVKPENPGISSKILFQSSINTAQAYNNWRGKSLYEYNSSENARSHMVSFNRPMRLYDFYRWKLPFIQWLELQGYEVEFCTNVDLHEDQDLLNNYKLFLSIGHDEYWSWEMRDNIDIFLNLGGNVAFFSGNTCWWQMRFAVQENNPNGQLICYKEVLENGIYKPGLDPNLTLPFPENQKTTCNWYLPITERPENLMTGVSFYNGVYHAPDTLPDAFYKARLNKHWLLKNTGLEYGSEFGVYDSINPVKHYRTIGYETDAAEFTDSDFKFPVPTGKLPVDIPGKSAPKDFMIIASSNLTTWSESGEGTSGYNNHNGWVTMGLYRRPNGGFGFTVGTTDWSEGLLFIIENQSVEDPWNETHQITKNVLEAFSNPIFEPQKFLIDNPDFEQWSDDPSIPGELLPVGWYKDGTGNIYRSTPGHSGSYCLKVDTTVGHTWVNQNYIPVRTNRQYRVKCWVKGSNPSENPANSITIRLQTLDNFFDFAIASYTGITNWQEISAVGIINSSETILRPARVKIEVDPGYTAYFDEVVVEEL